MTERMGWQHGLLSCFDDCGISILTYLVPCYTAGKNGEAVGENFTTTAWLQFIPIFNCILNSKIRGKIRLRFEIQGNFGLDLYTYIYCYYCALIQDYRQLNSVNTSPTPLKIQRV